MIQGGALGEAELVLEIFIDQVKFTVPLKSVLFLLGQKVLGGGWADGLTLDAVVDLGVSALQVRVDGFRRGLLQAAGSAGVRASLGSVLPWSLHLFLLPEQQSCAQDAEDNQDAEEAKEQELLGAL